MSNTRANPEPQPIRFMTLRELRIQDAGGVPTRPRPRSRPRLVLRTLRA